MHIPAKKTTGLLASLLYSTSVNVSYYMRVSIEQKFVVVCTVTLTMVKQKDLHVLGGAVANVFRVFAEYTNGRLKLRLHSQQGV